MNECWLAQFDPSSCDGVLQKAHLITKQQLRLLWREAHHGKDPRPHPAAAALPSTLVKLQADERTWRPACAYHHWLMDHGRRRLRVPRWAIPADVEQFADQLGLGWWLDRTYQELAA